MRDNITFGRPWEAGRYGACVAAACLEQDVAGLPAGDATELGERGLNVGGGLPGCFQLMHICTVRYMVFGMVFDCVGWSLAGCERLCLMGRFSATHGTRDFGYGKVRHVVQVLVKHDCALRCQQQEVAQAS